MSFKFQQFEVEDKSTAMKVGVDAIILGAFPSLFPNSKVLDVGAGCGIVSLMLAQRYSDSKIMSIEIDANACLDLQDNFANSKWKNQLSFVNSNFIKHKFSSKFDVIISNPPYFEENKSFVDSSRKVARQNISLSVEELCKRAAELMNVNSHFFVIFPYLQRDFFIKQAWLNNLFLAEELKISDKKKDCYKRSLLCFTNKTVNEVKNSSIFLKNENGGYSDSFVKLTEQFYL